MSRTRTILQRLAALERFVASEKARRKCRTYGKDRVRYRRKLTKKS